MKKLIVGALALMATLGASAQLVEVASVQQVALPQGVMVAIPAISPDGSFVAVSDMGRDGLSRIDVATGTATTLTSEQVGLDFCVAPDGSSVIYRNTITDRNHLRHTGLKSVDATSGAQTVLVKPSRTLSTGVAFEGATVAAVQGGKVRAKSLDGSKTATPAAIVAINRGHLDVTVGGKTTSIDPQGRGSYIWPSISPDGTKVLYYMVHKGAFVCDLDGSNPMALGQIQAAKWLDNNTVVGMDPYDDGHQFVKSSIIVSDLAGTRQTISTDDVVALYPSASADGKHIAFATATGELFIINLK